jgi:hypothetical protein
VAKITSLDIEVAHSLIAAKDLDGICDWIELHKIIIDKDVFRKTFYRIFLAGDVEKALKMFDAIGFEGQDPVLQLYVMKMVQSVGCLISVLVLLGCIGGFGFLITYLF